MVEEELTRKVIGCAMSTGIDIGLLINFGTSSLQFKRKYRELKNPVNPSNPVILSTKQRSVQSP